METINVIIIRDDGERTNIAVALDETVGDLKVKLEEEFNIPESKQILARNTVVLKTEYILRDCFLAENDEISLTSMFILRIHDGLERQRVKVHKFMTVGYMRSIYDRWWATGMLKNRRFGLVEGANIIRLNEMQLLCDYGITGESYVQVVDD